MATILIKKRDTTGAPGSGDLTNSSGGAEIAVNTADKRLYAKNSGGTVVEIGTDPATFSINSAYTFPTSDGTANYFLQTDGAGALSFAAALVSADIGVTVQGYDADTAKLDVAQTFSAQQTFTELKETTYTLGTSGSIALDPANGSIQSSTLSGNPTFTDSLEAGQVVVLMLNGGASYTVTWPTTTWVTSSGDAAPTLTANDTLVFWKVSTTLYGAYVGSYA